MKQESTNKKSNIEIQARQSAEFKLEQKIKELSEANQELKKMNKSLSNEIEISSKKMWSSEEQYKELVESISEVIYHASKNGTFIFMNRQGPTQFGYEVTEMIGQHFSKFIHPDYLESTLGFYSKMIENNLDETYFQFPILTKSGETRWMGQSVKAIRENGKIVKFAAVARDMTDRKKLLQELHEAKELAEASQRAEKQFLTNMSHEIRTPLNAIVGMSHLLKDSKLDKDQQEYIEVLNSSANILHSLISDILDISKIDSGNILAQPREFDLIKMLQTVERTFVIKLENKNVQIKTEIDPNLDTQVISDEKLLNQIFFNLLGNAEKFTDDGFIVLRVKIINRTEKSYRLSFEIEDTGIGISEKDIEKIFEKFKQVNLDKKYSYGGTGLGLPITKRLIEILGGELKVRSKLGEGTIFSFELNMDDSRSSIRKSDFKPISNSGTFLSSKHPILVVEDNVMNRKYIKRLLDKWKLDYEMVVDGLEAVKTSAIKKYSLILMDIQMPIMDGYEATAKIRKSQGINKNTPIVALTASSLISMKNRAMNLGMNEFLSKPFNPFQLAQVLRMYLAPDYAHKDRSNNEVSGEFRFNNTLNESFLQEAYGKDLYHAKDMFETFLKVVGTDYGALCVATNNNDLETSGKLAHKLKPIFTMVGLDPLTKVFEQLDAFAKAGNKASFMKLFYENDKDFDLQIDMIRSETRRLSNYLSSQGSN